MICSDTDARISKLAKGKSKQQQQLHNKIALNDFKSLSTAAPRKSWREFSNCKCVVCYDHFKNPTLKYTVSNWISPKSEKHSRRIKLENEKKKSSHEWKRSAANSENFRICYIGTCLFDGRQLLWRWLSTQTEYKKKLCMEAHSCLDRTKRQLFLEWIYCMNACAYKKVGENIIFSLKTN